jgi:ferredoxin-NADP reductase
MDDARDVTVLETIRCEDTLTLRFERPDSWDFSPGQYFTLYLQTSDGREGKPFSLASSPLDSWIEMTTRLSSSAFKKALARLESGERVEVRGPAGRFGLAEGATRPVFLAGGVGITPVMSILRHARDTGRELDATLFYGNVAGTCIPYEDELAALGEYVETIHVIEQASPDWPGRRGFIRAGIVAEHVPDLPECGYYVTGPPAMVGAMDSVLDELGIPPSQRHVEAFGR